MFPGNLSLAGGTIFPGTSAGLLTLSGNRSARSGHFSFELGRFHPLCRGAGNLDLRRHRRPGGLGRHVVATAGSLGLTHTSELTEDAPDADGGHLGAEATGLWQLEGNESLPSRSSGTADLPPASVTPAGLHRLARATLPLRP